MNQSDQNMSTAKTKKTAPCFDFDRSQWILKIRYCNMKNWVNCGRPNQFAKKFDQSFKFKPSNKNIGDLQKSETISAVNLFSARTI